MQIYIEKLEYHVTDNCNLACKFCSHYSNFHRPASHATLTDSIEQWTKWQPYLAPGRFSLIGGEPTLNPKLEDLAVAAKSLWKCPIWLYTNGTYLYRHPNLHKYIDNVIVSSHYSNMQPIEKELKRLSRFQVRGTKRWLHYYKDEKGNKLPYTDNNPRRSWEICVAKKCVVLKDNALWKCPQVAFHKDADIDWPEFNNYRPLTDPADLEEWLTIEEEECCSCCPAALKYHKKPLVQLTVNT